MDQEPTNGGEVLFERRGGAGVITLNRPAALNALNHRMIQALSRALSAWEEDEAVRFVVIKGEGRAFSAGGDIVDVYKAGRAGKASPDFFADEYRLNAHIARYGKPYVALIDGIAMGGGVGVSFHGSHRVMTENAVFAMPEVGIGFFPDVGGSHLLSRLGGYGMYLALTGNRIGWGDALRVGLATHALKSSDLPDLLERLAGADHPDDVLLSLAADVPAEGDEARFHAIDRHFTLGTLDDCLVSLQRAAEHEEDEFAREMLSTIRTRSPTSLHVAFRELCHGAMFSMDECMRMEFRILVRMLKNHDFYEGIRAALVDKTRDPSWKPASIEAVDPAAIDAFFAPLAEGELEL
ncbi:enoyl-CoA hydratase/isomerase family protein [Chelativorans sp. AA-79]|uniref:enoyl-CoA hydratase/isomerase family protein n=1 Tax=Chelativorans sp. AA-79 TaxID=3028735 RepID=UPI0023FA302A|nr:enoyl-CoA hydratase/isomerase family protein [Chelativorans sp. AA-79]WEX07469.1 enoyl-CoA hydratase/isomerase family protein [Chelativorans sp. AA-79]